jgi:hypothetical protein
MLKDKAIPVHPAALSDEDLLAQCDLSKTRSSGPGGQHRNKVETKVVICHRPTGIIGQAGERRSAVDNKRVALFRLRLLLATQIRNPVPLGEIGSPLWKSRCTGGKVVCNPEHHDYPALLAEALDVIAAAGDDAGKAALRLECTTSQLIKLVKDHPPALVQWNAARAARHLHPLK